ncbi:hypothetical protein EJ08DRAFT_682796 [Tothia fuscella]|uniref:Uncharacterized protein n=1 Tax=Tothia fuscella TaxID=1048955 RepID=A0A9P4NHV1_9PEZI|nr:hypothetical protein EJ08DRAFT_682796 [Tothia fuscella]
MPNHGRLEKKGRSSVQVSPPVGSRTNPPTRNILGSNKVDPPSPSFQRGSKIPDAEPNEIAQLAKRSLSRSPQKPALGPPTSYLKPRPNNSNDETPFRAIDEPSIPKEESHKGSEEARDDRVQSLSTSPYNARELRELANNFPNQSGISPIEQFSGPPSPTKAQKQIDLLGTFPRADNMGDKAGNEG